MFHTRPPRRSSFLNNIISQHNVSLGQDGLLAERLKFHFANYLSCDEIWNGKISGNAVYSNGLIRDWDRWQILKESSGNSTFKIFEKVLSILSHPDEPLRPGPSVRVSISDVREIPTLQTSYGLVPITHASAGVRRIVGLAYLLVWTWIEHVRACEIVGREPTDQLVLVLDEAELHLHPRWQRSIIPALLGVAKVLSEKIETQLIFTTHSPLILASIEPEFDTDRDKLFLFDIPNGKVELNEVPWTKQGDATNWLTSSIFGLSQARSREAETAIEAAEDLMIGRLDALPEGLKTKEQIHAELLRVLPDHDPFWPRWIVEVAEAKS